jgi:hypothetical protein
MLIRALFALALLFGLWTLYGNKDNNEDARGIISEQTLEPIHRAEGTEELILDAAEQQRQEMEGRGI